MPCQKRYTYHTIRNAEGERKKPSEIISVCKKEQVDTFHVAPYLRSGRPETVRMLAH